MLISLWQDKKKVVLDPYLAIKGKRMPMDKRSNTDESQKHYAKWKKTDTV